MAYVYVGYDRVVAIRKDDKTPRIILERVIEASAPRYVKRAGQRPGKQGPDLHLPLPAVLGQVKERSVLSEALRPKIN